MILVWPCRKCGKRNRHDTGDSDVSSYMKACSNCKNYFNIITTGKDKAVIIKQMYKKPFHKPKYKTSAEWQAIYQQEAELLADYWRIMDKND